MSAIRGRPLVIAALACGVASAASAAGPGAASHKLSVVLHPEAGRLEVEDSVTLPEGLKLKRGQVELLLHAGLSPQATSDGAVLERLEGKLPAQAPVPLERFRLTLPAGARSFSLRYQGSIAHPIEQQGAEYDRSFGTTPGLISAEGVFLAGDSYWLPRLGDELLRFEVEVKLPPGWDAVSQGQRVVRMGSADQAVVSWREEQPQDQVFLVAAPFSLTERLAGEVATMAYLRQPDAALAEKYLEATGQYLSMFERLIGPYPYAKFALVENFWETGYGMPSFTLLGPKIIRFPFILHSSYPHEILHNWWGNSVYVDYASGNWCEGLTAYLADHLIKEQRGEGAEYRRDTLQKYSDYVAEAKDFPVTAFRERHSAVTQAVGYGKTLMFFHMLRLELGDGLFTRFVQALYQQRRYQLTRFKDLERILTEVTGKKQRARFAEWIERPGAPVLELVKPRVSRTAKGYRLSLQVRQTQKGPAFHLQVPYAVTLEGQPQARQGLIELKGRSAAATLDLEARPLRVDLDPEFDLMRRLDRAEIPPALSAVFGADQPLFVLPSKAPASLQQALRALAQGWLEGRSDAGAIVLDKDLRRLPAGRAVWLLGWDNTHASRLRDQLAPYGVAFDAKGLRSPLGEVPRAGHSLLACARHPEDPALAVAWLASDSAAALPGLGRKLPHYGKYSLLGFSGDEPTNVVKAQWPTVGSPLVAVLAEDEGAQVPSARLARRPALASLPPAFSADRMLADVRFLAAKDLQGRGFGSAGLERAADWIGQQMASAGLRPAGDKGFFQRFSAKGGAPERDATLRNVIGEIPGRDPRLATQPLLVVAHYDHLGLGWPEGRAEDRGQVHPGADDNASGVALMLELARKLSSSLEPARPVRFVAFSGEEAELQGARDYLRRLGKDPAKKVYAVVNLDQVGRLGDRPLLAFGSGSAAEWVHILRGAGYVSGVAVQDQPKDIGSGDHSAFIGAGIPAIQLFSGVHLDAHRPGDTADKIDAEGMIKVAAVAREVVAYLADRAEPLSATGGQPAAAAHPGGGPRKVSLGTVPDFGYQGEGVRLSGTSPGSPAEAAGLRAQDVLLRLDGKPVRDLRGLSALLKEMKPGQEVEIEFRRGEENHRARLKLAER